MKKPLRLALLSVLSVVCLLALSFGPVFAEETTTPAATDPILAGSSDSAPDAVTGSPGDPADIDVTPIAVDELPTDVTPMEKDIDVTPIAEDGTVTATDVDAKDGTPAPEETTGDPAVLDDGIRTMTTHGADAATTPWPLMAGIGAAGLLVGFAAGFLSRKPKSAPKD